MWGKHAHNAAYCQDYSVAHESTNARKPPPDPQKRIEYDVDDHLRILR